MHTGAYQDTRSIAVVFHHWGPYHLARLEKAGEKIPIVGIEVSDNSPNYKWHAVRGIRRNLKQITLFYNADSRQLPSAVIIKRVKECLDKCRPVCVALPGWSPAHAMAGLWWCVKNNIPAVCMGDSTAWDWKRHWWKELLKHRLMKVFSSALASGTATSQYFDQLGMSEDRIFLGYDVVDNTYFQKSSEHFKTIEQDLRRDLNLSHPFFLVIGRFIPEKNLFHLMDAYANYVNHKGATAWDLVLCGDGPMRDQILSQRRQLGLEGHIKVPGFIQYNELPIYYSLAECLVLPSLKDTWGLVVNEAMASGLPVIVSKCCGCAEDLVQNEKNGFLIDPFNVDDIAEKMIKITRLSESERKAMGLRSQEIIASWGPERFASGLKAAVDKALEAGPKKISFWDKLLLKALILKP